MEEVQAAGLKRTDPAAYTELLASKYIEGVNEERPAVGPLNGLIASTAILELLARIHPYRDDGNAGFAAQYITLTHGCTQTESDGDRCPVVTRYAGRGDLCPLLGMASLSETGAAA